jgi:hypothetical protein
MNCPNCGKSLLLVRDRCPFCKTNIPAFIQSKILEAAQSPELTKQINSFVETVLASPALDDDELVRRLMGSGLSREVSERLLAFVPTAFARYIIEPKGPHFEPSFEIIDSDSGLSRRGLFSQENIYVAAREYAKGLGAAHSTVTTVAARSAEARGFADMGEASDLQFGEPVFQRIPLEAPPKPARPWWKLWHGLGSDVRPPIAGQ